jgi:phage shock protein PspC (stress-responsive transcriptional regulator)
MTSPPLSPSPAPTSTRGTERFLLWVAGLGVARSDGWLGGVCAGLAARLRIDPLIVRGVVVVATLFGLPLVFVYAVAWALLPDADGKIHLRELLHARFETAQLGILAMVILAFLPIPSVYSLFFGWSPFGGQAPLTYLLSSGRGVLTTGFFLVGLALVIALLVLIVRAARRTPGASSSEQRWASAAPEAPDTSATSGDSGITVADERGVDAPGTAVSAVAASTPASSEATDDLDAWREQHAAWKEQDQAWRRQQQDADRAARDQARRERQAEAAKFSAEASRRRRLRRASNPRVSGAYVAAVLGLALIAGAAVALWGEPSVGLALGLFVAALICAAGMVIAGMTRRRSGFLALLTVVTLIGGGAAAATSIAVTNHVVLGSFGVWNGEPRDVTQPFGYLSISLTPLEGSARPITVEKATGTTDIRIEPGTTLILDATLGGEGTVTWRTFRQKPNGELVVVDTGVWRGTANADGTRRVNERLGVPAEAEASAGSATVQPVTITQRSGDIVVTAYEPTAELEESAQ